MQIFSFLFSIFSFTKHKMQDATSSKHRNQINIAIIGTVSAGKSTLMNGLFVNTYSDMKLKRTTMTPQIYVETDIIEPKKLQKIRSDNTKTNIDLIAKTESKEKITINDIKETYHEVPKIHKLVNLENSVYLTIYDIPGLNDARTKDVYFEYLDNNFYKFDIIIFVVDIHSGLNTADEIMILEKILNNIKKNKESYDIINKLIVIANKCDEMQYEKKDCKILDEELEEMFEQVTLTVKQKVAEIIPNLIYSINPLSAEDSYIYRMYDRNPAYELDIKHVNKFGFNEYGKSRWNRLNDKKKSAKIKELMQKMDINDTLSHTGFKGFNETLNVFLNPKKQYIYLNNHLIYEMKQIVGYNTIDISNDIQHFYMIFQRYKEINELYKNKCGKWGKDKVNITIFTHHITNYLQGYKQNIISKYITNPDTDAKTISENSLEQVQQIKEQFEEMNRMFNGSCPQIKECLQSCTTSLNDFYITTINNKTKPINTTFDYLFKLLKHKYKITKEIISNIFKNNDMKSKSSEEIIEYIQNLENKHLITQDDIIIFILDFLESIYKSINNNVECGYIKKGDFSVYCYYTNQFWSYYIIKRQFIKSKYYDNLSYISYLSSINCIKTNNTCSYTTKDKFRSFDDMIKLEIYLKSIVCCSHKNDKLKSINSSPDNNYYSTSDDEYMSDELDNELGLELGSQC